MLILLVLGRSTFGMNPSTSNRPPVSPVPEANEEGAGLIAHAQDNPSSRAPSPYHEYGYYREDQPYESDLGYRGAAQQFRQEPLSYQPQTMGYQGVASQIQQEPLSYEPQTIGYPDEEPIQPQPVHPQQIHALSGQEYYQPTSPPRQGTVTPTYPAAGTYDEALADEPQADGRQPRNSTQIKVGQALWGPNPHQHADGPMI